MGLNIIYWVLPSNLLTRYPNSYPNRQTYCKCKSNGGAVEVHTTGWTSIQDMHWSKLQGRVKCE